MRTTPRASEPGSMLPEAQQVRGVQRDCDLGLKLSDASDALKVKFACRRAARCGAGKYPKRPRTSGRRRRSPMLNRTTRNACSPTL